MPIRLQSTAVTTAPVEAVPIPTVSGEPPREGVTGITWQGPGDGARVWDLMSTDTFGAMLTDGWEGYGALKPTRYTSTAVSIDGQRFRGRRFGPRSMTLPVVLWHDGESREMRQLWRDWWDSWSYDEPGTLTVTVGSESRSIGLHLDDPDSEPDNDPFWYGRTFVVVGAVADDPHWRGETIRRSFGMDAATRTMFDTAGTGQVFNISGGHTYASANITNPGDIAVRPDWTVSAPWTKVSLGVGTGSNYLTYATPSSSASDVLSITTDRGEVAAYLDHGDGVKIDVTEQLTAWGFASVPPGQNVPLTVQMDGTGIVEVSLTPRYFRPF